MIIAICILVVLTIIIIDMSSAEEDLIKCQFDKNPKEWMNNNYILLEVKIRQ